MVQFNLRKFKPYHLSLQGPRYLVQAMTHASQLRREFLSRVDNPVEHFLGKVYQVCTVRLYVLVLVQSTTKKIHHHHLSIFDFDFDCRT
jgi:hypothetical protein